METLVTLGIGSILEIRNPRKAVAQGVPTVGSVETVAPPYMPGISRLPFPQLRYNMYPDYNEKPTRHKEDSDLTGFQVEWVVAERQGGEGVRCCLSFSKLAVERRSQEANGLKGGTGCGRGGRGGNGVVAAETNQLINSTPIQQARGVSKSTSGWLRGAGVVIPD